MAFSVFPVVTTKFMVLDSVRRVSLHHVEVEAHLLCYNLPLKCNSVTY